MTDSSTEIEGLQTTEEYELDQKKATLSAHYACKINSPHVNKRKFSTMKVSYIAFIVFICIIFTIRPAIALSNDQMADEAELLKLPFVDDDVNFFEYRKTADLKFTKLTPFMKDTDVNSPVVFNVAAGEIVKGIQGVVITTKPGHAKVLKPIVLGGLQANPGDIIYILTYQGDGVCRVWYKGVQDSGVNIIDQSTFEELDQSEASGWYQVRNDKGQTGWSNLKENFEIIEQPRNNNRATEPVAQTPCALCDNIV